MIEKSYDRIEKMCERITQLERKKEKSSIGKKIESPKKSNFFLLELFSSNFFLVHIEAVVLQKL